MKTFWLLSAVLAVVGGCGSPTEPQPFRSAPDVLVVAGLPVSVKVQLFRDFMPTVPPEGRPLGGAVHLRVPGREDFPSIVRDAYLWVLNGDQVWFEVLRRQDDVSSPPDQVHFIPRDGGPRWGPEVFVDVVVGVRDERGRLSLGITRHVLIRRIA